MALVITCFSLCVCSLHIQNADTVDGNAGAMSLIAMDIWSHSCGFLLLHLGRRHQHLLRQITRNQHCGVHMEEQDVCSGHGLTLVQSPFSGQAPHRHEPVIFAVGSWFFIFAKRDLDRVNRGELQGRWNWETGILHLHQPAYHRETLCNSWWRLEVTVCARRTENIGDDLCVPASCLDIFVQLS